MREINGFEDFVKNLRYAGMSMGSENGEGIFTLCHYFTDKIKWHTEDQETDPWEWRIRVLDETKDVAYGKFFFKKSGFITKEWFPYFYAVRRRYESLQEEYEEGNISFEAKVIYDLLSEHRELPLHLIKQYGGFSKENKGKFDSAMTELQMKFYITMCGRKRKLSNTGHEYGWSSTVFCLTEDFFDQETLEKVGEIPLEEAYQALEQQVLKLNTQVQPKKLKKFILGS